MGEFLPGSGANVEADGKAIRGITYLQLLLNLVKLFIGVPSGGVETAPADRQNLASLRVRQQ